MKPVRSQAPRCAVALLLALLGQGCGSAPEYAKRTVTPEDAAATPSTAPSERGPRWPDLSVSSRSDADGKKDAAVIVAIEQYAFLPPIPGAFANGRDWYQYLTRARGIPLARLRFLSNAEATDFAITRAVGEASDAAEAGGRVWLVFIGHGAPSSTGEGLLVAADAQQSVDGLENRSVSQRKLLARMSQSAATPVAIVDACFSGRKQDGDVLIAGLQPSSVVKTSAPPRAVLLTAAASNQFAGPLPGEGRPAFSYLALGALRGWGDANQDGEVTAQEVVEYSRSVFMTLLAGSRIQTPEALGQSALPLAHGSERGPDLGYILLEMKSSAARPATSGAGVRHQATGAAELPSFDRDLAARKLNEAAMQAANCRPTNGPHGSGKVRLHYDTSGEVSAVEILTARFRGTTTGSCIQHVFRRASVTPFQGEDVNVIKTFEIPD